MNPSSQPPTKRGKLILLSGLNGVGKDEQSTRLIQRAKEAGLQLETVSVLKSTPSVTAMRTNILSAETKPESAFATALAFLAAHTEAIEQSLLPRLAAGENILLNRGVESTLVYNIMGDGLDEQHPELVSLHDHLFEQLAPDRVIIMDVPAEVAMARSRQQPETDQFQNHELELHERRRRDYLAVAKRLSWTVVESSGSIQEVNDLLWQQIEPLIKKPVMKEVTQNPFLEKKDGQLAITEAGYVELENIVTDTRGQVYAFDGRLSPVIVAAAMARLSRRSGDMRVAILDEFAQTGEKDAEALIERVVTGYGDDSVQQLIGIQLVVEEASNLLTKLLEWGRFGSYLEQSTRYIYFDQRGSDGKFLYYVPAMKPAVTAEYVKSMDSIFERYSGMVRQLTDYLRAKHPEPTDRKERMAWINSTRATACDAVRSVLPVATKSTVGIFGSAQAVESLVMHLLSEPLEEARHVGTLILNEARKVVPAFLKRADVPERGGATTAYRATTRAKVRDLARRKLNFEEPPRPSCDVELLAYWPKNELDLVPGMLFESAEPLSYTEIERQVGEWSPELREEAFQAYMGERLNRRHRPGRAIEEAHFEWEIDGKDYGTFRDLQRHRVVDAWEWQRLSPYFGYEVPELITEAALEEQFKSCFELSHSLYELLQEEGYELEAQYATLFGHQMRYRFMTNLRSLFHLLELRTGPAGHPGYRKICNRMYDLLKEVYPHSAAAMRFVNQREDPQLARQAAELATQYKLERLEAEREARGEDV